MKRFVSIFFLTVLLTSCSSPAGKAVKALGCTVQECCSSMRIGASLTGSHCTATEQKTAPTLPVSFEEIDGSEMFTW